MDKLDGRTAVITGGASGIGLAVARRLGAAGMNLVLADIEEPVLAEVVADLEARGVAVRGVRTDVSDRDSVAALASDAAEAFGPVHMLFNNAGVGVGSDLLDPRADFYERFDWTMGVNLMGVLHGIRSFVPAMLEHREPCHVVNTASMAGLLPARLGAYTVSKYAAVALTELLVQEVADTNVGVSVLCPFFVRTKIAQADRNLPEHLVRAAEPTAEDETRQAAIADLVAGGIESSVVADHVHDALLENRFWILPHDGAEEFPLRRAEHIAAGTAPMGLLD